MTGHLNFGGTGNENQQVVPQLSLYGSSGDNMIAGLTSFQFSDVNVRNRDGSFRSPEDVAEDAVHELLHTLRLDHPFENTQTADTELIEDFRGGYWTTKDTDKDIIYNIMNYGFTKINRRSFNDLKDGRRMDRLTKGQLQFMMKEIQLQKDGYGLNHAPIISSPCEKSFNIKKGNWNYKSYYSDYWIEFPGNETKRKR